MRIGRERAMRFVFFTAALTSVLAVALICVFLFASGVPAMAEIGFLDFLLGTDWSPADAEPSFGILPMILGSLYITAGAVLLGVPIGILTAVFMARMCPKPLYRFLKPAVNLMAGIPSVIYGFFGMMVLVPLIYDTFGKTFRLPGGDSMLAASALLAIMILPTVISIAETNLRSVPQELYEGAVALGASHERAVFKVVLPAARSGVMAAVVLGIGRAIGETMAVKMVAGNQTVLRAPYEFLRGARTMTTNIVIEMGYVEQGSLHNGALIATGVVLFVFILLINSLFSVLNSGKERRGRKKPAAEGAVV
ncbi:MAG: phosphate ABC transporter permease subunit PstC [Oscillospiraceae bacterium]|jgi:phosphate transport system permease protein|nr:phosphate ABC transporter permease subunit PstC [Oscillospiraceae bacterium]